MAQTKRVNEILTRAAAGDRLAAVDLLPLVYDELRALALKYVVRERVGHTLQPTALVHEAYLRLAGSQRQWAGKSHFLAVAAVAMRNVLVDYARQRGADKRGGRADRVSLEEVQMGRGDPEMEILELDDLINRIGELARDGLAWRS